MPNVSWEQDYRYESQNPHGGWVFNESILKTYGTRNVSYFDDIDSLSNDSNQLYINYGPSIIITQKKQKELDRFLSNNNTIFFIANDISSYNDTFSSFYISNYYDSLSQLTFTNIDTAKFNFSYFKNNINKPSIHSHSALDKETFPDSTFQSLATAQDSFIVFFKREHSNGRIFYHLNPYNFSNIASIQEDYLGHFNDVFSHFKADKIILDNPKKSDILQSEYADSSPIQYILSQASLAWAYYLTLISLLIFIFFRGKRKQRIIPISENNKNTSLEYVDTVSQLFLSQNQNRKLVEHLENIFFHKVKNKYFLDKSNGDFIHLFSLKSKIQKIEVDHIIDIFKNAKDGYDFTDDQLHRLHKKLETIYTSWK